LQRRPKTAGIAENIEVFPDKLTTQASFLQRRAAGEKQKTGLQIANKVVYNLPIAAAA
jgi:hypothetical protein